LGTLRDIGRAIGLKRARNFIRDQYHGIIFRHWMKRLLALPDPADPPAEIVSGLVAGWGNKKMSAWEDFIQAAIRHARETDGPILECGSGLSTLLLGLVADRTERHVFSLEDNAFWATKVRGVLRRYGVSNVEIFASELRGYGAYSWYDPPLDKLPRDFSLVVCDGPQGTTPGGRYGLLPLMRSRLRPGCIILLDDAHRPAEREIAARWARELGTSFTIEGHEKPFIRLSVPS
jgi:predicted O-methyltransferase YrrM